MAKLAPVSAHRNQPTVESFQGKGDALSPFQNRLQGTSFIFQVFFKILRPLARVLLKNEMTAIEAIKCLKLAFVEAAEGDFALQRKKMSNARISVLTGLDRNEVSRIRKQVNREGIPVNQVANDQENLNRAARVATNWPKDDAGEPAILTYEETNSTSTMRLHKKDSRKSNQIITVEGISFSELVQKFSGGIPPKAILDELIRTGMVIKHADNTVELQQSTFIPKDKEAKLNIASTHLSRFINVIDKNMQANSREEQSLQLELSFDDLPDQFANTFKQLSKKEGRAMLEKWNQDLLAHIKEKKIPPNIEGTMNSKVPRKTGVGLYFYDEKDEI